MKQTAVEWLVEQLPLIQQEGLRDIFEQAKQIEKKQIIKAIDYCRDKYIDSENYYNETYGGNK
jgi:hypothetical protein